MSERTTQESRVDGEGPADGDVAVSPAEAPAGDAHETADASETAVEIDVAVAVDELGGRGRTAPEADPAADAGTPPEAESEEDDDGDAVSDDESCPHQSLSGRVEALLFASDRPLTERRLAQLCGLPAAGAVGRVREALDELGGLLRASGRSFRPRKVAGGWQLVTLPAFGPLMARLHRDRQETRLSPAAMETLSIIAYRQPVLRAELEAIRGVACGEVLRSLLERRMISIVGRSEDLGRPMLYGTTRQFLEVFGLSSLDDLPMIDGLERRPPPRPAVRPDDEAAGDAVDETAAGGQAPADEAVAAAAASGTDVEPGETADPVAADSQDEAVEPSRSGAAMAGDPEDVVAAVDADTDASDREESDR